MASMVVWFLLGGQASVAQVPGSQDDQAKGWFVNGQHLYKNGRYRDALVAFEAAYRMSERPNILRSIAYCHENLGEYKEAIHVLYRYRGLADEEKVPEIQQHIRRLQEKLAPPEPLPVVIDPEPDPEPDPEAPLVLVSSSDNQSRGAGAWKVSTGPGLVYGAAGVALVTGGVFGLQAMSSRAEAESQCSSGDAGFCPRSAARHINDDAAYSMYADICFGVGGAALIGATVWMFMENSQKTSVQVVPMGSGLGLVGSF